MRLMQKLGQLLVTVHSCGMCRNYLVNAFRHSTCQPLHDGTIRHDVKRPASPRRRKTAASGEAGMCPLGKVSLSCQADSREIRLTTDLGLLLGREIESGLFRLRCHINVLTG